MKILLTIIFLITTTNTFCQSIFPSLSPKARIEQIIGLTDIIVDYERPAARGRKVFGELVKYNNLWRTGAGNCTKITFSKPVIIDNKKINKGSYSVFTIPNKNEWTVILNTDTTLYGIASYDKRNDIIRFKAKAQWTSRYYESLTIDIDVKPNNALVYISWEKTQISFKVETETDKMANDFIEQNLMTGKSNDADEYAMAAEYYFYLNKDLDRALNLIDKAITKKNESWYHRQKIDILEKQMKYKEAINALKKHISFVTENSVDLGWDAKTLKNVIDESKTRILKLENLIKKNE